MTAKPVVIDMDFSKLEERVLAFLAKKEIEFVVIEEYFEGNDLPIGLASLSTCRYFEPPDMQVIPREKSWEQLNRGKLTKKQRRGV